MKCEQYAADTLEEFLDGELDARRAAEVGAHLAACRACALAYDELLDEQTIYASYERDLDTTPQALWVGVAARIAAEQQQPQQRQPRGKSPVETNLFGRGRAWLAAALVAPRFSPALTAAMMLIAIGATATVMRYLNPTPAAPHGLAESAPAATATPSHVVVAVRQPTPEATPGDAQTVAQNGGTRGGATADIKEPGKESEKTRKPEPPPRREAERKPAAALNDAAQILAAGQNNAGQNNEINRRQRATGRLVREAEAKYLAAIRMLAEDVNRKRTRLDPQVAARFDETLATIDRSIAETRRTVLQQRNDPVAVQYMLSAYAKKVEVMREMAALD
ncbi:MAG TPA: zf-HC2 domain-containing protein [Pyrinomonadaceae bacterium]|nr:zf-HC2 domain-containing protein [Pyrinomonadaceae bacterium]